MLPLDANLVDDAIVVPATVVASLASVGLVAIPRLALARRTTTTGIPASMVDARADAIGSRASLAGGIALAGLRARETPTSSPTA